MVFNSLLSSIAERIRWSPPHRLYVRLTNARHEQYLRAEAEFYRKIVHKGQLVFDVGANIGFKSEIFLSLGARVIAVEPDPWSAAILRRRFIFNRRLVVEELALSDRVGTSKLYIDKPGSAYNTLNSKWRDQKHVNFAREVETRLCRLEDLIAKHGVPDFLKIDVEGYEREVLLGLTIPPKLLSFEVNLPEFLSETLECITQLKRLHGDYRFKIVECMEQQNWSEIDTMTSGEVISLLEDGRLRYCEIFAMRP